jgi:hypothetical protein
MRKRDLKFLDYSSLLDKPENHKGRMEAMEAYRLINEELKDELPTFLNIMFDHWSILIIYFSKLQADFDLRLVEMWLPELPELGITHQPHASIVKGYKLTSLSSGPTDLFTKSVLHIAAATRHSQSLRHSKSISNDIENGPSMLRSNTVLTSTLSREENTRSHYGLGMSSFLSGGQFLSATIAAPSRRERVHLPKTTMNTPLQNSASSLLSQDSADDSVSQASEVFSHRLTVHLSGGPEPLINRDELMALVDTKNQEKTPTNGQASSHLGSVYSDPGFGKSGDQETISTSSSRPLSPEQSQPRPVKFKPFECVSLYPYTPRSEVEMELEVGTQLTVYRSTQDDPPWWYGKSNLGKKGWFPSNYTEKK